MGAPLPIRISLGSRYQSRELLLIYLESDGISDEAISATVREQLSNGLVPDDIAIVCHEHLADSLGSRFSTSISLNSLLVRLKDRTSLQIIGFGVSGEESSRHLFGPTTPVSQIALFKLLQSALAVLANQRGAVLEATDTHHFRNPSGRHSSYFLKLSNALIDRREISLIAATLLHFIPADATTVHIDTPALFAVVGALNDHFSIFGLPRKLIASNFSSYLGLASYNFLGDSSYVVIISASTSGSMRRALIDKNGVAGDRIIHCLYLGKEVCPPLTACDLGHAISGQEAQAGLLATSDSCQACNIGSIPIDITGDRFDLGGIEFSTIDIGRAHRPPNLDLIPRRLIGSGALEVSTSNSGNLRLYRVSVANLLSAEMYQRDLAYAVARCVPRQLGAVINLGDPGSRLFATHINNLIELSADTPQGTASEFESGRLRIGPGAILVLAGVVDSGRALKALSLTLRLIAPEAPVVFLVGFSKSSGADLERLRTTLTYTDKIVRHELVTVYDLTLPSANHPNPWARELRLLQDPLFERCWDKDSRSAFESRRQMLLSSGTAIQNDLFWPSVNDDGLRLTPGFAFWQPPPENYSDASQADVFFTISAVLESARRRGGRGAIHSTPMEQTVLSEENFTRFSDPVIQASLLRAARPAELNYSGLPEEGAKVRQLLKRILGAPRTARGQSAIEFMIAVAVRQLRLSPTDMKDVIAATDTSVPVLRALALYARESASLLSL